MAPLSGVLAVVLWVLGLIVNSSKVKGSTGPRLLASYQHHHNAILFGGFLFALGTILFTWFLGSLRSRYLVAEGGAGRLTALAYGSGIGAAVMGFLVMGPDMSAALEKKHLDASAALALHDLGDAFFIGAEYILAVFFFAGAILALRYAVMPRWLGWVNLLIGVVLLIGPIGWAALIFAFPIWILLVSIWLWRTTAPVAAAPA
ncbi:MAG: hypothetical protein WBB76_06705 [Gaiellaceae bacterium]